MRESWSGEVLKNVTLFKSGKTISKAIEKRSGDVLYVKVGDMNLEGNEESITTSSRYVDSKDIKENQIIPIGAIIFPKRGGAIATNKKRIIVKPTIVDLNTMAISPSNRLHSEYLYYWFQSIDLQKLSNGTSIPQINNNSFDNVLISFPKSLSEQKQIVAILDEAFTAIDQAKANIEKNIQNAKELFQSKLNDIFSQKGDGWEEKTLKEIAKDFGRGKSKNRPRNDSKLFGGRYPFVQTGDVRNTGKILTTYSQTYNEVGLAQSKLWPKGTICITIAANIAETAILDFDSCFPDSIIGLVVDSKLADSDYTYYSLQFLKGKLQELGKGSAQDNINLGTFQKQYFPFPNIKRQKGIVLILDKISLQTSQVESKYQQKLLELEELKKSILQKAFAGELTNKMVEV